MDKCEVNPVGRSVEEMGREIERLRQRVEELERDEALIRLEERASWSEGKHIIANDQIDSAWKQLQKLEEEGDEFDAGLIAPALQRCLAKLGIKRCPACRRKKEIMTWGEAQEMISCQTCKKFTGHGWVKE